jgi:hypothetical protein
MAAARRSRCASRGVNYGSMLVRNCEQEASRLVVPDKRASGPFSTRALTGFYRLQHLDEPLALTCDPRRHCYIGAFPLSFSTYRSAK